MCVNMSDGGIDEVCFRICYRTHYNTLIAYSHTLYVPSKIPRTVPPVNSGIDHFVRVCGGVLCWWVGAWVGVGVIFIGNSRRTFRVCENINRIRRAIINKKLGASCLLAHACM